MGSKRSHSRNSNRRSTVFEKHKCDRAYRKMLVDFMEQEPVKTIHKKGRAVGMSSSRMVMKNRSVGRSDQSTVWVEFDDMALQTGDYWITNISKDHVKECMKCGYRHRWKDYTKFIHTMTRREYERKLKICIKCGNSYWNCKNLTNALDKTIATMNGELF